MPVNRNPERLAWLLKNRPIWEPYNFNRRTLRITFQVMQTAGLYSHSTVSHYYTALPSLLREARIIIRSNYATRSKDGFSSLARLRQ